MGEVVPVERIATKIYLIRNIKVMLDRDLAKLYSVKTKLLKQGSIFQLWVLNFN